MPTDLTVYKPGDIIGVADESWLSRSIRAATGNGPVSHIMIVTATVPFVQVTEALDHVKVNPLVDRLAKSTIAYLMSPITVTDSDRLSAVHVALSRVADRYNYGDILLQGLDSLNATKFWTDHFAGTREPICSMLAAQSWACLHLDIKSETPNDFFRLALGYPDHWALSRLQVGRDANPV